MRHTDTALSPSDDVAKLLLTRHEVGKAVKRVLAKGLPTEFVSTELMAHACQMMLPNLTLEQTREQAMEMWEHVFREMGRLLTPPGNSP